MGPRIHKILIVMSTIFCHINKNQVICKVALPIHKACSVHDRSNAILVVNKFYSSRYFIW